MHTTSPHKRDTLCFLSIARHSTAESTEGGDSQLPSSCTTGQNHGCETKTDLHIYEDKHSFGKSF